MKLSELRPLLEELGLRPSKALGQNFLHDVNAARAVVAGLDAAPGASVIEIGPGLGALTSHLLKTGADVLCIEKDRRLAEWLAGRFGSSASANAPEANGSGRFELIVGDACRIDQRPLLLRGPSQIIGNLPYSVSTPLLLRWGGPLLNPARMVFTLQRELAERVCAQVGESDYGALSVAIQSRYAARILRHLPPQLFYPEPSVDSSVVELRRLGPHERQPHSAARLRALVNAAFQGRRKMVAKTLRGLFTGGAGECEATLAEVGIPRAARPEQVPVEAWIALARAGHSGHVAQDPAGEMFDVVDASDQVIGKASRREVHERGLRHRAVHIFLQNREGEIWLQRRSHLKDRHPGVWDSSAAGHLDAGESYAEGAAREVMEETGLRGHAPKLKEIAAIEACEETGWEFVRLYVGRCDGPFDPPPEEIEFGEFFELGMLRRWVAARPGDFAPGFIRCLQVAELL